MSTAIYETPARRAHKENADSPDGIPEKARQRVEKKSPRGKRCLIEGFSMQKSSNACHVVGRALSTNDGIMTGFEYHMNLTYGTLNLHSSYNLFYANAAVHHMCDHGKIALIPSVEVLNLFLPANGQLPSRDTFDGVMTKVFECAEYSPEDQEQKKTPIFTYTLVPLTKDVEDVILVHEHPGTPGQQPITFHRYPFTDFPKIKSHIRPQFVLISLGRLLRDEDPATLLSMDEDFSPDGHRIPFYEIVQLYRQWSTAPIDWKDDPSFSDAGRPFPEEDSDDPKDKSYRPSGSVVSSTRTQPKRDLTGMFKLPMAPSRAPSSPTRSSGHGGDGSDLTTQLAARRTKRAKTTDGGSKKARTAGSSSKRGK